MTVRGGPDVADFEGYARAFRANAAGTLDAMEETLAAAAARAGEPEDALPQAVRDAAAALVQLGRPEEEAVRAVREIAARPDAPADTAAIVRLALAGR